MSFDPQKVSRKVARRGQSIVQGFAQFLLRGRVSDLAVGVVIGAAIGALINAFVRDVFTPIIGAIFGSRIEFSDRVIQLGSEKILYGAFLNEAISFLVIALVVYFFIIVPMNALTTNSYLEPPPDPAMRKCPECQADIPKIARRCMYCTQPVAPQASAPVQAP